MIAVDAGVHLSSIVRILQQQMPLYSEKEAPAEYSRILDHGPFAGVRCTSYSARANALHIFRELMHAFLITHPHLDHLAAMGINTPALEYGREAKTIVALDSTIEAIKSHIFNDSIWPNLSDEGSGVGFVTYRRLKEGGNVRLGSGDARGYVRVCDSLATLCMGVTHGKCKAKPIPISHGRSESAGWHDPYAYHSTRRLSRISDHESYVAAVASQQGHNPPVSASYFHPGPGPTTPGVPGFSGMHTPNLSAVDGEPFEPVKSSAFFILNEETNKEILIFGDIEPDAVSMSPQNYKVWRTAAPKVANGTIKAMFIECSYDESVRDTDLYGHLCPRHLIQELLFLAKEVAEYKDQKRIASPADTPQPSIELKRSADQPAPSERKSKRKRLNGVNPAADGELPPTHDGPSVQSPYVGTRSATSKRKPSITNVPDDISPVSLRALSPSRSSKHVHFSGSQPKHLSQSMLSPSPVTAPSNYPPPLNLQSAMHQPSIDTDNGYTERQPDPMKGLTVHIIHVKDTLVDGPSPGTIIARQLRAQAAEAGLECEFDITDFGQTIWV